MVASCTRSLGWAIWREKSNPSLKVKRQFEKSNGKFAWWRESRKPTWGGSPPPSTRRPRRPSWGRTPSSQPATLHLYKEGPGCPSSLHPTPPKTLALAAGLLQVVAALGFLQVAKL